MISCKNEQKEALDGKGKPEEAAASKSPNNAGGLKALGKDLRFNRKLLEDILPTDEECAMTVSFFSITAGFSFLSSGEPWKDKFHPNSRIGCLKVVCERNRRAMRFSFWLPFSRFYEGGTQSRFFRCYCPG